MDHLQPSSDQLLTAARLAAESAYARYSGFRVGAAIVAEGKLYTGANVENASYGLTICAERVAIAQAVIAGHRKITAVAVVCLDAAKESEPALRMPCGACRQVMAEFAEPGCQVYLEGIDPLTVEDLLPNAFRL